MKISIIGAGGHVGVPFALVCAEAGHDVTGIDIDADRNLLLNSGIMPFYEAGASQLLRRHINNRLYFTNKYDSLKQADVVVVMIGTPVDGEGNPRLDDIFEVAETIRHHKGSNEPIVILRSTVAPGTTELFNMRVGKVENVFYIPERVLQGKGIEETQKHIWIVGTSEKFQGPLPERLCELVTTIGVRTYMVSWKEAEIGKLMTNMYRYVNFAFANEMYMIGRKNKVDIHKVIQLFNEGYDRLNVPMPGPNVGGPCLFKDGKFLTIGFPYPELISTAFHINEGMPEYVLEQVLEMRPVHKLLILGATFKANSDDIRNSLSFKLAKCCKVKGIDYDIYDPHVAKYAGYPKYLDDYDAAIVMTPHKVFYENSFLPNLNEHVELIFDPWEGDTYEKSK